MNLEESLEQRRLNRQFDGGLAHWPCYLVLSALLVYFTVFPLRKAQQEGLDPHLAIIDSLGKNPQRRLCVNACHAEDLILVQGIGPQTAANLVDVRTFIGRFEKMRDLRLVPGIGISRLQEFNSQLTVRDHDRTE